MLSQKDVIDIATAAVALAVFIVGLLKFFDAIKIRRYEKFHEMSVRFDDNDAIQAVCGLLNGAIDAEEPVTKQQIQVFICFLEEVDFMIASMIMKEEVALYTFGYYARLAEDSHLFWDRLPKGAKDEPLYSRFRAFCKKAKNYTPSSEPSAFRF